MPQFGGKDSKRHFTVVMGGKEHGLYVSSTPSSAAKKAVTKLCAANKSKKVEFHIREITQGSKKKTYGPYSGYIEKLKEPIELKGRVIKYKPVAKLSGKTGVKKGGMRGGWPGEIQIKSILAEISPHSGVYPFILEFNGKTYKYYLHISDDDDDKKNYYVYDKTKHKIISNFYDLNEKKLDSIFSLIHKFPPNEIIIITMKTSNENQMKTSEKFNNLNRLNNIFKKIE
jgi:hypothetical protein